MIRSPLVIVAALLTVLTARLGPVQAQTAEDFQKGQMQQHDQRQRDDDRKAHDKKAGQTAKTKDDDASDGKFDEDDQADAADDATDVGDDKIGDDLPED